MPPIKREAVYASIRNQLMNDPQKGTILLLNLLKLFADRKDDGEFVKEIADLASDLASAESPYAQSPLFAQPMPMPYLQSSDGSIPVPTFTGFNPGEPPQPVHQPNKPQPEAQQKEIADDVVSALNQMGEDTAQFARKKSEPVIEGYEEWKPKHNKNKPRPNHK